MDQLHGLPTGGNVTLVPEHGMSHQSDSMTNPSILQLNKQQHPAPFYIIQQQQQQHQLEVKLVSAEAPVIFAKACEMFIMELTMRAWGNLEKNKRTTLRSNDMVIAIKGSHVFDFLHDVVPSNDAVDYKMYADILRGDIIPIENTSYNYMSPRHAVGPPSPLGMVIERPILDQSHDEQQILPF
ncbi:hypothetical protein RIF29_18886 [Crotalaria pallida]|uniref:Core Histone H2A/H2B/H3 domain-containing protein n=1 Tax=Crotalaria pallida TaxID=3830 RepID=A0AAN9I5Z2_CROPI